MPDRRQFLWGGLAAAGGLAVGFAPMAHRTLRHLIHAPPLGDPGWIHIAPDNSITLYTSLSELGQGIWTAVAQLVAEELEADWSQLTVATAPAWRAYQAPVGFWTSGSTSIQRMFESMRTIGACARMMLIAAAARSWKVPASECHAALGEVHHSSSGARMAFGALAEAAATLSIPAAPGLKPRSEWRLIGKPMARIELASKVDGSARYGLDLRLPGMLYAAIEQTPEPGATLLSADREMARAQPGVLKVIDLPDGIAVVAARYWQAQAGLAKANPRWSASATDTQQIAAKLRAMANDPASATDPVTVDALYEVPLLVHMQMEPLNVTALVERFSAQLWAPTQAQTDMRRAVAKAIGQWEHTITVHTALVGGGFGRRLSPDDGVAAARVAHQLRGIPVKVVWSRENDSIQGRFRPMSAARLRARLGPDGAVESLQASVASLGNDDRTGGLACTSYALPPLQARYSGLHAPIRTGSWRSVNNSQNVFYRESFIDECAHAAGIDPLAYRRRLLAAHPRALRVLDRLAELLQQTPAALPTAHAGYAFSDALGSFAALAAEVEPGNNGAWQLLRVFAVIDCGTVINPAQIRAQMEGGILFGLSAAMSERATFMNGRLQQTNYDRYPVLRLNNSPPIEIGILESPGAPVGGIGEAGVPLIAPALANAIHAATGRRLRSLPLRPANPA